jgi:lipopolysaccharide export system permease protein
MPWTLYGYILRELAKLLLMVTAVLVVVMSFGFTIKPISEGLLGPWQLVKVVGYTMPGMLTFAMPFAAAFSGTMVFYRMQADNEITACSVSGISYRGLLVPVVMLGLGLTLGLFWMSNWVVPRFWEAVSREVEQDVARLVVRQVQRREVAKLGRLLLYADSAVDGVPVTEPRPPGSPMPYDRLVLDGVAVGKLNSEERVLAADYTARRAVVDLYRDAHQERSYATMMLSEVTINDPGSGTLVAVERQPIERQEIPSFFTQRPKFMSLPRLRRTAEEPERGTEVRAAKRLLAESMAQRVMLSRLGASLRAGQPAALTGPRGEQYQLRSAAARLAEDRLWLGGTEGRAEVRSIRDGLVVQRLEAERATVEVKFDEFADEPRLTIELSEVTVIDAGHPQPGRLRTVPLALLRQTEPVLGPLEAMPLARLIEAASAIDAPSVRERMTALTGRIEDLLSAIDAQLHGRAAMAVNCMLVLILGVVMSALLRGRVPLAIFFWCFVPTVAAFLTITSGQNMIESSQFHPAFGQAMTWSGNAGLLAVVLLAYTRLCRN